MSSSKPALTPTAPQARHSLWLGSERLEMGLPRYRAHLLRLPSSSSLVSHYQAGLSRQHFGNDARGVRGWGLVRGQHDDEEAACPH